MNKGNQFTLDQWEGICPHTNVLQSVINSEGISTDKNLFVQTALSEVKTIYNMLRQHYSSEEVLAKPPLEGGPKTAKTPEDSVPASQLLKEIDISPSLTQVQTRQLQGVLDLHKEAFGLEGKLGNYAEDVDIPLHPNTKPISIPPYQVSPASHEVIDKQMDAWIQLGVIEPSKSPWGAPVFIAY